VTALVAGLEGLREWSDAFDDSVPTLALQPRADLAAPLQNLRDEIGPERGVWTFAGEPAPDLGPMIHAHLSW
jgi:hypothetical protein